MFPRRCIALIAAIIAVNSCSNPTAPSDLPRSGATAFYPATVGNTWVYVVTDGDGQFVRTDTVRVIDVDGDVVTYEYRSSPDGPPPPDQRFRITDSSVTRLDRPDGEEETVLPGQLKVGTKWLSYYSSHEVVATGVRVSTPARSFDDVVAISSITCSGYGPNPCYMPITSVSFLARGVGSVKSATMDLGGKLTEERTLVTFTRK